MHILNRAQRRLWWAAYRQNDPSNLLALPGKSGALDPGQGIDVGMEQDSVKLRVGFVDGGGSVFDGPFINTHLVVIGPSEKPVDMDDDATRWSAMAQGENYRATRTRLEALNASSRALASSLRSLVALVPTQLGPVKALAGLVMFALFEEQRPPPPPTLDDIKAALAQVVADAQAQRDAAAIMTAWVWLTDWEAKVAGLKAAGTVPSDVELADFDYYLRGVFGPDSQSYSAMRHLQANDAARRSVVPTYILGIGLFTKLHLLDIARWGLARNLIRKDYDPLLRFLADSRQALNATSRQITNEYIALLQRYDIAPSPEALAIASGWNIAAVGAACGGDSPAAFMKDRLAELDLVEASVRGAVNGLPH